MRGNTGRRATTGTSGAARTKRQHGKERHRNEERHGREERRRDEDDDRHQKDADRDSHRREERRRRDEDEDRHPCRHQKDADRDSHRREERRRRDEDRDGHKSHAARVDIRMMPGMRDNAIMQLVKQQQGAAALAAYAEGRQDRRREGSPTPVDRERDPDRSRPHDDGRREPEGGGTSDEDRPFQARIEAMLDEWVKRVRQHEWAEADKLRSQLEVMGVMPGLVRPNDRKVTEHPLQPLVENYCSACRRKLWTAAKAIKPLLLVQGVDVDSDDFCPSKYGVDARGWTPASMSKAERTGLGSEGRPLTDQELEWIKAKKEKDWVKAYALREEMMAQGHMPQGETDPDRYFRMRIAKLRAQTKGLLTPSGRGAEPPKLCVNFLFGTCTRGDWCVYHHGESSDAAREAYRASHDPCHHFTVGACHKGASCHFRHLTAGEARAFCEEKKRLRPVCKFFLEGRCNKGSACIKAPTKYSIYFSHTYR